jgi:outer membrane immunogenic protein
MKRLLFAIGVAIITFVQGAFAATPVPYTNLTGLYIGGHGGFGWGSSYWVDDPRFGGSVLGTHDISGWLGGGQIGFNWQMGPWLLSVEGAGSFTDIYGNHVDAVLSDLHTKIESLATVTGRFGYVINNNFVIYVKGGGAWGSFKYQDFDTTVAGSPLNGAGSSNRSGWVFGGGFEYLFLPQWSLFVEFLHFDFGTATVDFSGGIGGNFVQTISDDVDVLKFGVNFIIPVPAPAP